MTAKEMKRLSRRELLEMLIEQGKENSILRAELEKAEAALSDRDIQMNKAGTLAEAAFCLNKVYASVDNAAKQYYENVRKKADEAYDGVIADARKKADAILADAHRRAEEILAGAGNCGSGETQKVDYEALLREYRQKQSAGKEQ